MLYFRYTNQVSFGPDLAKSDFQLGSKVTVLPGQRISEEFLNSVVGTEGGQAVYGRTGISFDPANPKVVGLTFVVAATDPELRFTEPFPENMRNRWNSLFPFTVEVLPSG